MPRLSPVYALLELLQTASRHRLFSPLHFAARRAYLHILTPCLQAAFRLGFNRKPLPVLEPRNSAVSGAGFNVFSSDIDYSLIVPDSCTGREIRELMRKFKMMTRALPMVQELEIYSVSDRERFREINASHGDLLLALRLVRKIAGQAEVLRAAATSYHRAKAQRSIAKAIAALDPGAPAAETGGYARISRGLENLLAAGFPPPPPAAAALFADADAYSSFLGCRLCAVPRAAEFLQGGRAAPGRGGEPSSAGGDPAPRTGKQELRLSAGTLFILACLLPDSADVFPAQRVVVAAQRRTPALRAACRAVFLAEAMTSLSVHYVRPAEDKLTLPWIARLEALLEELR
ncbi:MAG TPA: hypothetical protein PKI19_01975 [Elusimicrobiales bacterium]|nr:hypothetical protein [Elusimicrobiales bacterium]